MDGKTSIKPVMPLDEILMYFTVRLECKMKGGAVQTGTGFFFTFRIDDTTHYPVIVTNRHVIEGAVSGTFSLTLAETDPYRPIIGSTETVTLENFESLWTKHPDPTVDLAVLRVGKVVNAVRERGKQIFCPWLEERFIASGEDGLHAFENVVMVGYPNGLWDEKNNMPIVRRGVTATNPKIDYNGTPRFLIDCACFPGSSGSPVFKFEPANKFVDRDGRLREGPTLMLLGILHAGPQHIVRGGIQMIDTNLAQVPISVASIPNNLGFVIKASKLLDFKPISTPKQKHIGKLPEY